MCGEEPDMEIGPDDDMPKTTESALLIEVIRGAEEVEKMKCWWRMWRKHEILI
jgi:hypothetical protein